MKSGFDAGAAKVSSRVATVLDRLDEFPASALALGKDRLALSVDPCSASTLLLNESVKRNGPALRNPRDNHGTMTPCFSDPRRLEASARSA
jgi:hypothetical protein